jgi:hypothetical protein
MVRTKVVMIKFEITRTLALSGWNSEIPLSEIYRFNNKSNVAQFVFLVLLEQSIDNVYFNKVAIVAPPAAAHIPVTFETGEYGSTWVLTSLTIQGFSLY